MIKKYIFKLQRSLATYDQIEKVLIYNKRRSLQWEQPLTKEFKKLFGRTNLKIYMHGRYRTSDGKILLDKLAPQQDW